MKDRTCLVTGIPISEMSEKYYNLLGIEMTRLRTELEDAIENAVKRGYDRFISGAEIGSDTIAQWACEELFWERDNLEFVKTLDVRKEVYNSSMLIAIYDGNQKSSIYPIINEAKKNNLEIIIILPQEQFKL